MIPNDGDVGDGGDEDGNEVDDDAPEVHTRHQQGSCAYAYGSFMYMKDDFATYVGTNRRRQRRRRRCKEMAVGEIQI